MRKPRILQPDASYHITARANHRELLMEPGSVKEMFLNVVAAAKKRFSFRLDNFVVMDNHFHFLLQPFDGANLSEIMKWILQTFAIRYNRANGLWGHFWGSRFFSWIVPSAEAFLRAFRYLDENPVRAGLVETAEDWPWGALGMRKKGPPPWVDPLPDWLKPEFPSHASFS